MTDSRGQTGDRDVAYDPKRASKGQGFPLAIGSGLSDCESDGSAALPIVKILARAFD